jgi:4-hydroxy-3-methylbut-2-enyl diphosphate reductase
VLVDSVIDALGRLGPVEVSTLPGREEHMEFRLPAELTEGFATRTVSRAS